MVGAVRRGNHEDALVRAKPVHFDEQLVKSLLALVVSAAETSAALTADRVDFIDENVQGEFFFAWSNRSRTRDAPTPTYISTKSEPEMEKNGTPPPRPPRGPAGVYPVPGGPTSRTPLGTRDRVP